VAGYTPVAVILVREVNGALAGLAKQIDERMEKAGKRYGWDAGVYFVVCSDCPCLQDQLKELITKKKIKNVVFCTTPKPPANYNVAEEANVTAMVFNEHGVVAANFALRKSEVTKEKRKSIFDTVVKYLP
jgi:hypothetical protein